MSRGCADRQTYVHERFHSLTRALTAVRSPPPAPPPHHAVHPFTIHFAWPSIHTSIHPSIHTSRGRRGNTYPGGRPARRAQKGKMCIGRQTDGKADRKADSWADMLTYEHTTGFACSQVSQSLSQSVDSPIQCSIVTCVFGHDCVWESDVNVVVCSTVFCGYQSASRS